jgi:hypothetical protein
MDGKHNCYRLIVLYKHIQEVLLHNIYVFRPSLRQTAVIYDGWAVIIAMVSGQVHVTTVTDRYYSSNNVILGRKDRRRNAHAWRWCVAQVYGSKKYLLINGKKCYVCCHSSTTKLTLRCWLMLIMLGMSPVSRHMTSESLTTHHKKHRKCDYLDNSS